MGTDGSLNFNNEINTKGDDFIHDEDTAFHGNFIDDDFGLTSIAQESEKIRLQQLKIEAEVRITHIQPNLRRWVIVVFLLL